MQMETVVNQQIIDLCQVILWQIKTYFSNWVIWKNDASQKLLLPDTVYKTQNAACY